MLIRLLLSLWLLGCGPTPKYASAVPEKSTSTAPHVPADWRSHGIVAWVLWTGPAWRSAVRYWMERLGDPSQRVQAAQTLAELQASEAIKPIFDLLEAGHDEAVMATALCNMNHPHAWRLLQTSKSPTVAAAIGANYETTASHAERRQIIRTLLKIGDPAAIPALVKAAKSYQQPKTALMAAKTLLAWSVSGHAQDWMHIVSDSNAPKEVRYSALQLLAAHPEPAVEAPLLEILNGDPNGDPLAFIGLAGEALGRLGSATAVAGLERCLTLRDRHGRDEAKRCRLALVRIEGAARAPTNRLPPLKTLLAELDRAQSNGSDRVDLGHAIARQPRALPALQKRLRTAPRRIRALGFERFRLEMARSAARLMWSSNAPIKKRFASDIKAIYETFAAGARAPDAHPGWDARNLKSLAWAYDHLLRDWKTVAACEGKPECLEKHLNGRNQQVAEMAAYGLGHMPKKPGVVRALASVFDVTWRPPESRITEIALWALKRQSRPSDLPVLQSARSGLFKISRRIKRLNDVLYAFDMLIAMLAHQQRESAR